MRAPNKYDEELEEARKDAWAAGTAWAAREAAWYARAASEAAASDAAWYAAWYASAAEDDELEYQINRVLEVLE